MANAIIEFVRLHAECKDLRKKAREMAAEKTQLEETIKEALIERGETEVNLPDNAGTICVQQKVKKMPVNKNDIAKNIAKRVGMPQEEVEHAIKGMTRSVESSKLRVIKGRVGKRSKKGDTRRKGRVSELIEAFEESQFND